MRIRVNGGDIHFSGATVLDLIRERKLKPDSVIVELNGEIIHGDRHEKVCLDEGDRVEIVLFVGGG